MIEVLDDFRGELGRKVFDRLLDLGQPVFWKPGSPGGDSLNGDGG